MLNSDQISLQIITNPNELHNKKYFPDRGIPLFACLKLKIISRFGQVIEFGYFSDKVQ